MKDTKKEDKKIFFTYDRHGNAREVQAPDKNSDQEYQNFWEALIEVRGVYASKEAAEEAAKPQFIQTGICRKTGEAYGYWS